MKVTSPGLASPSPATVSEGVRESGVQIRAPVLTSPTNLGTQFPCSEPVFSPLKWSF